MAGMPSVRLSTLFLLKEMLNEAFHRKSPDRSTSPLNWNSQPRFSIEPALPRKVPKPDVQGSYGISNIASPGQPISFQLYQVEETVNPETGDFIIKDVGGPENGGPDGRIDNNDLQIVGSPLPVHFGGFNHTLSYKNFDLAVFFQWSYGNDIYNETRGFVEDVGRPTISAIGNNLSRQALDRWTRPGDAGRTFRGINYGNNYASQPIDRYLEDGSYLRLKNVSLGYTLPGRVLGKWGIESLRVYATANNLLTFTRYSGFDPEVSHNIETNVATGIDSGTFPQAQTYLFGLNVTF